jgi:hypothetical protein
MGSRPDDRRLGVSRWLAVLILAAVTVGAGDAQIPPPATGNGRIVSLAGELSVRRGAMAAQFLKLHELVQVGDEIATGSNSEAVIQASDGSTIRIFPDSRVIFSEKSPGIQGFLQLFLGSIKVHIEKLSGRPNPHTMTTPTAIIAVRGTTFSVFVDETDATLVAVDEGIVAVSNVRLPSQELLLRGGQKTWVMPGQPPMLAARFRGPSERADMIPARGSMGMQGGAMGGAGAGQGSDSGSRGMGAMGGRGGPPH